MTYRSWLRGLALALGCAVLVPIASAQNPSPVRREAAPGREAAPVREAAPKAEAAKDTTVRGRIVRVQGTDQFIVRTPENKEVTFYISPDTQYLINNKAGRYSDLRVGSDVSAAYATQGDRYIVNSVTVGNAAPADAAPPVPQPAAPAEGTVVQGTVVRAVGQDQVIIRTADGKEVIVYVNPQTTYNFNDQPAKFVDVQPGSEIRVDYDLRDKRIMARTLRGLTGRNR